MFYCISCIISAASQCGLLNSAYKAAFTFFKVLSLAKTDQDINKQRRRNLTEEEEKDELISNSGHAKTLNKVTLMVTNLS